MKVLVTAFNGKNNSSKILLDNITKEYDKLYLKNSFPTSEKQLLQQIKNGNYDLIISLGEAPLNMDEIKIETQAIKNKDIKNTNHDYKKIYNNMEENYKVIISTNAGNWYCNNIYYYGLKTIEDLKLNTQMIFIHIPPISKISNIRNLCKRIEI